MEEKARRIRMTLGELSDAAQPRGGVPSPLERLGSLPMLPASANYRIAKFLKAAGEEIARFEKARVALCQRLGAVANMTTRNYDVPSDKRQEFEKELYALRAELVEFEANVIEVPAASTGLTAMDWVALEKLAVPK